MPWIFAICFTKRPHISSRIVRNRVAGATSIVQPMERIRCDCDWARRSGRDAPSSELLMQPSHDEIRARRSWIISSCRSTLSLKRFSARRSTVSSSVPSLAVCQLAFDTAFGTRRSLGGSKLGENHPSDEAESEARKMQGHSYDDDFTRIPGNFTQNLPHSMR